MIFDVLVYILKKINHQHLPTLPVYCSHFTLGNPKKSFFQQCYSYMGIIYIISEETNCNLPM